MKLTAFKTVSSQQSRNQQMPVSVAIILQWFRSAAIFTKDEHRLGLSLVL